MAFDSKGLDDYIDVAQRIAEFRVKHPEGSLQPLNPEQPFEIREVGGIGKDGKEVRGTFIIYVAAAYRSPDDPRPGVGCAYEVFPGRTPYTAGSELQNAETAAWGRAIVAALAADTRAGVASQQEVRNRQAERGQSAADAFENAAPAPARQNGSQQRGHASGPVQQPEAAAPPSADVDVDAQAFADEAHGAVTTHDIEDIHRRAREAGKLTALVRNPSSDGKGKPGKLAVYLDWKRKQIKELDDALLDLTTAASETGFPVAEIETHVRSVTGTDLEVANVAQIRHATQVLRSMQEAA
jgi:hypothetical protein